MKQKAEGYCPKCEKELVGFIELKGAVFGRNMNMMMFEESPNRNWIQCDGCSKTICKDCCSNPKSGYCDRCFKLVHIPETQFIPQEEKVK